MYKCNALCDYLLVKATCNIALEFGYEGNFWNNFSV